MNLETREQAEQAWGQFLNDYGAKYPKAVASLIDNQKQLLSFFDFPAEHWGTYPLGQPDRIRIRDASISPAGDQRCGLTSQGAVDGLQALGHGEPTMEARQLTLARRAGVA